MKGLGGEAPHARGGGFSFLNGTFGLFGCLVAIGATLFAVNVAIAQRSWTAGLAAPIIGLAAGAVCFATPFAAAWIAYAVVRPFFNACMTRSVYDNTVRRSAVALLLGYAAVCVIVASILSIVILVDWIGD